MARDYPTVSTKLTVGCFKILLIPLYLSLQAYLFRTSLEKVVATG